MVHRVFHNLTKRQNLFLQSMVIARVNTIQSRLFKLSQIEVFLVKITPFLIHLMANCDCSFIQLFWFFRLIFPRKASFIEILRQGMSLSGTVKSSRSQTLVWCEKCIMRYMRCRSRRNCQLNGWHLSHFTNRYLLQKAMC